MGISLRLNNLVSPQLLMLSKEFEKLDLLANSLTKTLGKISVDVAGLKSLASATNATNRAFERASVSAETFQRHLSAIQATSRVGILPPVGSRGGGGGGRGGIHGGNIHIGAGGIGLGTAGIAAGDWFWPLAASGMAIYGGKALYESAKDLNTEQARFRLFGMTEAQNQEAFRYAAGLQVYGTTQVERLSAMREAQGVFRESGLSGSAALEGSKLAAPILAKLDVLSSALDEESQAKMHTANLAMLRYVESSGGLKSAAEFNRIADFGYKLNVSSGGTVNWENLRQLKARAGAAGFHLTDDALARLEPVIAELKGGAVGFGLSTAFNRLTGAIRVPNQIAHELIDQGIWDRSAIEFNKMGGIKQFTRPGGPLSKDKIELLSSNPERFYEEYIKPMYDKMKLDSAEIARQNVMIFGTTGGRNMTLIDNQLQNIHRSVEALAKTSGIDAASKQAKDTLSGQEQEFIAAWTDFETKFGTAALPFFSGILKAGAVILRALPKVADSTVTALPQAALSPNPLGTIGSRLGLDLGNWLMKKKDTPEVTVSTTINLDGQKVAESTSRHQAKSASAPQTGLSDFDWLSTLTPAGGL